MFKLPPLPFDQGALAPHMSSDTLATHHGKHHAGYIKKLNTALESRKDAPAALEDVIQLAVREKDGGLFNNAAQTWNHGFFWQSLSAEAQPQPTGKLAAAIDKAFGSFSSFRDEFLSRGEKHFASGWVWLVAGADGAVKIVDTHDAASPIVEAGVTPLLTCDVWEHAYYIDYKNDRAAFLKAFFDKLANWQFAAQQHEAVLAGGKGGWTFPT